MLVLDQIKDQVGFLVMNEDGAVLSSGGELENSESTANIISGLISITDKLEQEDEGYKKLSIIFKNSSYVVTLSNKKVYVVKKRFEEVSLESENGLNEPPSVVV